MRPHAAPTLSDNEVYIWRAALDVDAKEAAYLSSFLSDDERERAARFIFPRDRDHFVVARGRLRELLGRYLNCSPTSLKFQSGRYGKPFLRDATIKDSPIRFNLSHSYGLGVYVFSMNRDLGIDVEKIRPEFAGEEIAQRYFSKAEREELQKIPVELRTTSFFLCWTRKEAYVKAHGDGLQLPLDSFDVSLTPGAPETLHSADSSKWTIRSFTPAAEFVASICVEQPLNAVHYWNADGGIGASDANNRE